MLFISSLSQATLHGVYAIEVQPPAQIQALGTGRAAIVGQFPWGPDGELYEAPSIAEAKKTFAPPGMSRLATGYLAMIAKAWPELVLVRVLGTSAAKAAKTLQDSSVDTFTVTAKYKGVAGNSISVEVADATDGDANHFNLIAAVTGASGTTTEKIENLNVSGTGDDVYPSTTAELDQLLLLGGFTKVAAGRPDNGTFTLTSGADGTINAAAYTGTAGTGDKGIALLEADKGIRHVTTDDCGNTLRASVNAGLKTHVEAMGDRMAHIHGNSAQSASAARTDALTYASKYVRYYDPWVYLFDDTTGSKQLVPAAPFGASVAAQLSPSTSIAAKASEVTTGMLGGIVGLEAQRGLGAGANTTGGVVTVIKEENGGYAFEADVTTIAPSNPAIKRGTRTQMGIYIASALQRSLRPLVDSPNVRATWDLILPPMHAFLDGLKRNADRDPFHLPCIKDFGIGAIEVANTPAEIQAGDLKVPIQITTIAPIERLLFLMQFGETVTVTFQQ